MANKPSEMYLEMIVSDIIDIVEDDMAYYLGHDPENQEDWDPEDRMPNRLLKLLQEMVDEKWPRQRRKKK